MDECVHEVAAHVLAELDALVFHRDGERALEEVDQLWIHVMGAQDER